MKKYSYILLFSLAALLLGACSSNDIPDGEDPNDKNTIEIGINSKNYTIHKTSTKSATVRATDAGTAEEQEVENLYLFLFDNAGANAVKYYISSATFTGGSWSDTDKKVTLSMTQAAAGTRQVYIVANVAETLLSDVTTVEELKAKLVSTDNPWSPDLKTPILMVGNKTHDFLSNRVLTAVALERALAKIELNIDLEKSFQSKITTSGETVPEYQYRFVNFDKETYVINPGSKAESDLVTSEWLNWPKDGVTTSGDDIATKLELSTYLNERFTSGAYIEVRMHYNDGGLLPPPEFAPETYTFPTFDKVERNHKYVFDAEISASAEETTP